MPKQNNRTTEQKNKSRPRVLQDLDIFSLGLGIENNNIYCLLVLSRNLRQDETRPRNFSRSRAALVWIVLKNTIKIVILQSQM